MEKKCQHKFHEGKCVRLRNYSANKGTMEERLAKFKEAQTKKLPLKKPELTKQRAYYVDACNPESNPHPYAHLM